MFVIYVGVNLQTKKIIDEKREKCRAKNGFLRNTSTNSKRATFVNFEKHQRAACQKERIESNEESKEEGWLFIRRGYKKRREC